ncbi:hypothetical protein GCM10022393_12140 [Aquimarina addita]|uniref:Uncharacterized protein n=1 Tax=Aquimarina addita TaxID=870485 RepID=A0ABP7XES7_9FLAO
MTVSFYGQEASAKRISFLNLVGNNIQVPRGCEAQSEYELQACNGTSIKWDYYSDDMLSAVFDATIEAFGADNSSKTQVTFTSFEAQLTGFKFKTGEAFQYFLKGTIKGQPLMINLGTPTDITGTSDLEGFLKLFFDTAQVG